MVADLYQSPIWGVAATAMEFERGNGCCLAVGFVCCYGF